jgi:hypothetical protein
MVLTNLHIVLKQISFFNKIGFGLLKYAKRNEWIRTIKNTGKLFALYSTLCN